METNRLFVAIAAGLLAMTEDRLTAACDKIGDLFELDRLQQPGKPGIAVGDSDAERTPFRQWLHMKRTEGVIAVRVAVDDSGDCEPPPHIRNALAGGIPLLLTVSSRETRHTYLQGTVAGPRRLLTASLFVELINCQRDPAFFWKPILEEINEFRSCNGGENLEADRLVSHLQSGGGEQDWEDIGEQVFREMQVEALTHEVDFAIPARFAPYVERVQPFHDGFEPHVWLEAYDEDEVAGAHLLLLVDAQDFGERVWEICADRDLLSETVGDEFDLDEFPTLPARRWRAFLSGLPAEEAELVRGEIIEVVRRECALRHIEPRIPAALSEIFGPDDEERRRLHFRARLQHDLGWALKLTPRPSTMLVLDRLNGPVALAPAPTLAISKEAFISALSSIEEFARRTSSPFQTSFRCARSLIEDECHDLDGALSALWEDELEGRHAREMVSKSVDALRAVGLSADRVHGLASIAIADVFGGMGTWNDQSFDEVDDVVFQSVSARLFTAMNRYYEALVSIDA